MSVIYRKATSKDEEVLFELGVEFTKFNQQHGDAREDFFYENWEVGFKEEIHSDLFNPKCIIYLAEDLEKGLVIGYIIGRYCEDCYYFAIDELYVDDGYRGQAVGKTLIAKTIEDAKQFDAPIRIEVFNWNTSALELYKKLGFTPNATILELYDNNETVK